jgi:HK97 gp10 family phage protein
MATIEGLERLKKRFDRLPAEVFDQVGKAIETGADEIADMQKRLAPIRTGALRDSIAVSLDGKPPRYAAFRPQKGGKSVASETGMMAVITAGNTKVRYAHLVEFGTAPHVVGGEFKGAEHPGARAEPFFYPAYRALKRRVRGRISRAFSKAVKQARAGG